MNEKDGTFYGKGIPEFLKEAQQQHDRIRKQIKITDPEYQKEYNKAQVALAAVRRRQQLEALGRWVINRCIIGDTGGTSKA